MRTGTWIVEVSVRCHRCSLVGGYTVQECNSATFQENLKHGTQNEKNGSEWLESTNNFNVNHSFLNLKLSYGGGNVRVIIVKRSADQC